MILLSLLGMPLSRGMQRATMLEEEHKGGTQKMLLGTQSLLMSKMMNQPHRCYWWCRIPMEVAAVGRGVAPVGRGVAAVGRGVAVEGRGVAAEGRIMSPVLGEREEGTMLVVVPPMGWQQKYHVQVNGTSTWTGHSHH